MKDKNYDLIFLGFLILFSIIYIFGITQTKTVGYGDAPIYVNHADNFLESGKWESDYVQFFFAQHEPELPHPEVNWYLFPAITILFSYLFFPFIILGIFGYTIYRWRKKT